jgi:hypothetical protein
VISSNWQALQQQMKAAKEAAAASGQPTSFRRKRKDIDDPQDGSSNGGIGTAAKRQIGSLGRNTALTHVVAIDCEMVGVGPDGGRDSLARVSVVSSWGRAPGSGLQAPGSGRRRSAGACGGCKWRGPVGWGDIWKLGRTSCVCLCGDLTEKARGWIRS